MPTIAIHENGIQLVLETPADAPVRLLQFAPEGTPLDVPEKLYHCFPLVEVRGTGIAASVASAIAPEQCGAWAYPLRDDDDEAVAVNMVNAMLLRMFVSGHLAELSDSRRALMAEAIAAYKKIRNDIREGVSFWPLGMPEYPDAWLAYGTTAGSRSYLSLWNMGDETGSIALSLPQFRGQPLEIDAVYPVRRPVAWQWHPESATLRVQLTKGSARVLRIVQSPDGVQANIGLQMATEVESLIKKI